MARVRVGLSSAGGARGRPSGGPPVYQGTMSGYGQTRADSVGFNPKNPYAYLGTLGAKAYASPAGTPTPSLDPPKAKSPI